MKHSISVVALLVSIFVAAGAVVAQEPSETPKEAIMGFDPIELIAGREILGNTELAVDHGGLRYLFVSTENRQKFLADPERYGVQLGNLCARLGGTTAGDQDLYTVFEGRIYVLASNHCVEVFEEAPHRFIEPVSPSLRETAAPDARARGDELVTFAIEALGGAAAIEGIDNMVEELVQPRPDAGSVIEMPRTVVLDIAGSRRRRETALPAGPFVQVWTPASSWQQGFGHIDDYSPAQAANLAEELVIANPVYILALRGREGFVAASRGQGDAEVLEHVAVAWGDLRWTLGIEPRTGMLASITFTARGPEGNWGEVTHFLSDYRRVGAINWPHRRIVTFAGESVPWWNTGTRAVRFNAELADDLFTRPAEPGNR